MGLGQGIQDAGQLWAQAIMGKHEEDQRLKKEALARQLEQQQIDETSRYHDILRGNQEFDNIQALMNRVPDGTRISGQAVNSIKDPIQREAFFRPELKINSPDVAIDATPTGDYLTRPQTNDKLDVQKLKNQAIAGTDASRERVAAQRAAASQIYQQARIAVAQGGLKVKQGALEESIRDHKARVEAGLYNNDTDALEDFRKTVLNITAKHPGFTPSMPPPARSGGAAPTGKIDFSKVKISNGG